MFSPSSFYMAAAGLCCSSGPFTIMDAMTSRDNAAESTPPQNRWLTRGVLGIGLASLFSDWGHEAATAILPAFLASLGAPAFALGVIEGVSDGLSSFAKLAGGWIADRPR